MKIKLEATVIAELDVEKLMPVHEWYEVLGKDIFNDNIHHWEIQEYIGNMSIPEHIELLQNALDKIDDADKFDEADANIEIYAWRPL